MRSLIPIITVRLALLSPSDDHHTLHDIVISNTLIQLALHWAMVSECLTCLKPFLQTWHDGVPGDASTPRYWGTLSNTHSQPSKGRSGLEKSKKRISRAHQATEDDSGALKLRADDSGFSTNIASERKGSTWMPEADDDIELLPAKSIRVTTTLTSS